MTTLMANCRTLTTTNGTSRRFALFAQEPAIAGYARQGPLTLRVDDSGDQSKHRHLNRVETIQQERLHFAAEPFDGVAIDVLEAVADDHHGDGEQTGQIQAVIPRRRKVS